MTTFSAADGTRLAYHRGRDGDPLICLPGGPMNASSDLDDLGGLPGLVRLDLRGTGDSAEPTDPASYRCDRQVDDVEALRVHLGLDTITLLGHSAGANLAVAYAARHPDRIKRLVLITPSPGGVGLPVTDDDRRELAESRRGEPWFPPAYAAFTRIWAGDATDGDWAAIQPFLWGRWDEAARAHVAAGNAGRNEAAATVYASSYDPAATRAGLAALNAPVLLLAGELDVAMPPRVAAEYAALSPRANLVIQPRAGHFPWHDNSEWFVHTVSDHLKADRSGTPGGAT